MPPITRVLETALYVADLPGAARFYETVLGLTPMSDSDRLVPMDAGGGTVLLLFQRGSTRDGAEAPGGFIPPHHAAGPAHFALAVPAESLDDWRGHLAAHDVEIESEVEWPRGGTSLYFRDPDGHSVELATPGVWSVY